MSLHMMIRGDMQGVRQRLRMQCLWVGALQDSADLPPWVTRGPPQWPMIDADKKTEINNSVLELFGLSESWSELQERCVDLYTSHLFNYPVEQHINIALEHEFQDIAGHHTKTIAQTPGVNFFQLAYRILHPMGWMSDATIDMYLNTLRDKYNVADKDEDIHIGYGLKFYTSPGGDERMPANMDHTISRKKLYSKTAVVFPVNMWQNHWVTLIIYPKEKRIVMYDFLFDAGVKHKPRMAAVKEWWNKWASGELDKRTSALPIAERGQYKIPDDGVVVHGRSNNSFYVEQTDGESCGIYVCVLCKCIAEGCMPTPELMNRTTMRMQHRYMIAKEILDYHKTLSKQ